MPPDAGPRARITGRGGGVPARPRVADAHGGLGAAEPVRGLPRGALRAGEPRLRPVAADEVPLVRRARCARLSGPRDPPGEKPAGHPRGRASDRPDLPRRDQAHGSGRPRVGAAAAAPRGGGPVGARRPAGRAGAEAEGAEEPARAARAHRGGGRARARLRGSASAHERARALGSGLSGAGRRRRARRCRRRGSPRRGGRTRGGAEALVLVALVLGRRDPRRRAPRACRGPCDGCRVIRPFELTDATPVADMLLELDKLVTYDDGTPESARFVTSRAFRPARRTVISVLEPKPVEVSIPPDTRLHALGEVLARQEELFNLYRTAEADMPADDAHGRMTLEEWRRETLEHPHLDREGSSILEVGGQLASLTFLLVDREGRRAENEMTGTLPELRGKGLATLCKQASIRWAAENGIAQIWTGNDEENAAMIAVNRRLGYRPVKVLADYSLELETAP